LTGKKKRAAGDGWGCGKLRSISAKQGFQNHRAEVRCELGEIDIIAWMEDAGVVEVKTERTTIRSRRQLNGEKKKQ